MYKIAIFQKYSPRPHGEGDSHTLPIVPTVPSATPPGLNIFLHLSSRQHTIINKFNKETASMLIVSLLHHFCTFSLSWTEPK